jgi:Flp pilus assembly protein TadG
MTFFRPKLTSLVLLFLAVSAICVAAQNPPPAPAQAPEQTTQSSRLTIEVTGGVKYVEEHAIKKDKKLELNVKTNRDGVAHVAEAPLGRALVQVIAEGWKTYGRWYDISDPHQVIKVRLERPPQWY